MSMQKRTPAFSFKFLRDSLDQGTISSFDLHFAQFMAKLAKTHDAELIMLFAKLSQASSRQDSCLDLSDYTQFSNKQSDKGALKDKLRELPCLKEIALDELQAENDGNELNTPLILSADKLYLQRYFQYETNIAKALIQRNHASPGASDFSEVLNLLFPDAEENNESRHIDWQKQAAFQSLSRQLTIISGGPGTGKTSTVVKILAALVSQNDKLRVKLAAPTGKAAARLSESIKQALVNIPAALRANIPSDVSTIHRLLGMRGDGNSFKHHHENQISTELVILDEVSMIDLAMFDRLLGAIPLKAKLILLGDPAQLLSVDNGAVLTDLSKLGVHYDDAFSALTKQSLGYDLPAPSEPSQGSKHALSNAFCHLKKSYRFSGDAGIGQLAEAIRQEQLPSFEDDAEVSYIEDFSVPTLTQRLLKEYQDYFNLAKALQPAEQLLAAFDKVRVLSPVREGEFGIEALNAAIEVSFYKENGYKDSAHQPYYHGKAVIITKNDYKLGLFNGDIGLCIQGPTGEFRMAFRGEGGEINEYLISRLPPFEPCFVMSVHKAQGSEFDRVSLILPELPSGARDLMTRELIYTAVTRAKSHISIYAERDTLISCLAVSASRIGGLRERFL